MAHDDDGVELAKEWQRLARKGYDVDIGLSFAHLVGAPLEDRQVSTTQERLPGRPRYEWLTWRSRRVLMRSREDGSIEVGVDDSETARQVPVDA